MVCIFVFNMEKPIIDCIGYCSCKLLMKLKCILLIFSFMFSTNIDLTPSLADHSGQLIHIKY